MSVQIIPMPRTYLPISPRLRPGAPPIFPDGEPTEDERDLAVELFLALDPESQAWYRASHPRLFNGL